jgi:hypothetical protein
MALPPLRLIEDGAGLAIVFAGGKPSRPIMQGLSDLTARLAWMDKQGIGRRQISRCEVAGRMPQPRCRKFSSVPVAKQRQAENAHG